VPLGSRRRIAEVPKIDGCARDLRVLVDGGYRVTRVTPVDQFMFSPHIELVAVLER